MLNTKQMYCMFEKTAVVPKTFPNMRLDEEISRQQEFERTRFSLKTSWGTYSIASNAIAM